MLKNLRFFAKIKGRSARTIATLQTQKPCVLVVFQLITHVYQTVPILTFDKYKPQKRPINIISDSLPSMRQNKASLFELVKKIASFPGKLFQPSLLVRFNLSDLQDNSRKLSNLLIGR